MRSLLFVPADSPRKLEKAIDCSADALILDLEDSVALTAKEAARRGAAEFLRKHGGTDTGPLLLVRINALDSGLADADLDMVAACNPHGIMLPKASGGGDIQHLGAKLAVREAETDLVEGSIGILPIVSETASAIFAMGSYRGASKRLFAMTWGADVGAETTRDERGDFTPPFQLARNLMLFAAASAQVDAIDTVCANFRDGKLLQRECIEARRDGFVGKMAIHPDQVAVINAVFTSSQEALEHAKAIVSAFAETPDAGVLSINGAMIDRPHLRQAQRLLARTGLVR
ncbi:MAG: CoA ester lyase [Beijerinckiaceae bacterium]|nr:CoA ester lyase [Beijerinckiaceae bacterium]